MSDLPGIAFCVLFAAAGVMLIVGANRRWRWLVDPPRELWLCYSQAFVRHVFGEMSVLVSRTSSGFCLSR